MKTKRRERSKNKSIFSSLMYSNLLVIFIPVVVLFLILFIQIYEYSSEEINDQKLLSLRQNSNYLNQMSNDVLHLSNSIYLDPEINKIVSTKKFMTSFESILASNSVLQKLKLYNNALYDKNYKPAIFTFNGFSYILSETSIPYNPLLTEEYPKWLNEVIDKNGMICYFSAFQCESIANIFPNYSAFAIRLLKNSNSGRNIGILVIGMQNNVIQSFFAQESDNPNFIGVMDNDGILFSSSNESLIGEDISNKPFYSKLKNYDIGYFKDTVWDKSGMVYFATTSISDWKIISLVQRNTKWPSYFVEITIVILGILILTLIKTIYNARYISNQMNKIINEIHMLETINLSKRLSSNSIRELNDFITAFNGTLNQIEELFTNIKQHEKEKRHLEIEALQAQIKPHFLYNTLASIRFMIQMEEYDNADQALLSLVQLLRNSFADQREIVSLAFELNILEDYMKIMQFRYQNTFVYSIKMDEKLAKCKIPKFSLQPIVENSISHGFNQKNELGHIDITIIEKLGEILLSISDDGETFDNNGLLNDKVEKVNALIRDADLYFNRNMHRNIGIQNTELRIKRNFGINYGLNATKNEKGGMTINMKLPLKQNEAKV